MSRFLPILFSFAFAAAALAQQQEQGLMDRIDANRKRGLQAMDGRSKPDPALANSLGQKTFGGSTFGTKSFAAGSFNGTKTASLKTFETRSFLGIKNPWFGRKVFGTYTNQFEGREAKESRDKFKTDGYAVREFTKGDKVDLKDTAATLPRAAQPRPYLIAGKTQSGVDQFTQNLQKDLTIDEVRDLLNKGQSK